MEQMLGGEFSAGLSDLSSGLEDLRNQSGAITSLDLTSVLLSERRWGQFDFVGWPLEIKDKTLRRKQNENYKDIPFR